MTFDESKEEPLTEPDTNNATLIHPQEGTAPENDPNKWRRLSLINTGAVDSFGNRDEETSQIQDRLASWDAMAGVGNLDLTDYQKAEGRRHMETLDLRRLGGRIHLASFCVASLVVRDDRHSERSYHPRRSSEKNCDIFLSVADDFDWNVDRLHGYLNRVEDKL